MTELETMTLKMTAGYYADALMRCDPAMLDQAERAILRALIIHGLRSIKNGDEPILSVPEIDGESFTV